MSKWSELLRQAREAPTEHAAHQVFLKACARAFVGTGFVPVSFNAWNPIDSSTLLEVHLKLVVRSLLEQRPIEEMMPRPAGVPDPRIHLGSQHPKRRRGTKKRPGFLAYRRG